MGVANEEEITDLPFNPLNIVMTDEELLEFLQRFGVNTFYNIDRYRCAFVHKSYCTRKNENFHNGNTKCPDGCLPLQEESYEVLEFIGDAILSKVVATYLVERYPEQNEGFYTRMRTKLVNGKMLSKLSKDIGFQKYLIISHQIEESNGRNITSILEDVLEAFIGAIYMDHMEGGKQATDGDENASEWIVNMLESNIDFAELIKKNNNYKDTLLKYFRANMGYVPRFVETDITVQNHRKVFKVALKDQNDGLIAIGEGGSKKDAENNASKAALEKLSIPHS
jgi:ribonuclease-3